MDDHLDDIMQINRRQFFGQVGVGAAALAGLMGSAPLLGAAPKGATMSPLPHFAPKARRVIYLFQSGAPSQIDLFDHKPMLRDRQGEDLPESIRQGQRLTGMTSGQDAFPVASSKFKFKKYGESGCELSELLPHTSRVADDICVIRSVHTNAINHDPGVTFIQTGSELPGRPCLGSWISYGLGSETQDLPAFIVLISQGSSARDSQPLFARLWGRGFLPSSHQGVQFRSKGDPVLYLSDPPGRTEAARREMIDTINKINRMRLGVVGDPEIATRIAQYEMAYRMQTSVPDLLDLSGEKDTTFEMYGPEARKPGTFAANCLLARRLAERGVRFIQLYHRGWDQHENLPTDIAAQARDTDQASAALISDLKQRGMLDDTLVIWGGEFGRTVYCQGPLTVDNYGRDHHPRCFSIWMAGGGIKPGMTLGATDDYSYNIAERPVHVHDIQATILHCLGIDHEKLTYRFQGRDFRLTDVHGHVVREVLA